MNSIRNDSVIVNNTNSYETYSFLWKLREQPYTWIKQSLERITMKLATSGMRCALYSWDRQKAAWRNWSGFLTIFHWQKKARRREVASWIRITWKIRGQFRLSSFFARPFEEFEEFVKLHGTTNFQRQRLWHLVSDSFNWEVRKGDVADNLSPVLMKARGRNIILLGN